MLRAVDDGAVEEGGGEEEEAEYYDDDEEYYVGQEEEGGAYGDAPPPPPPQQQEEEQQDYDDHEPVRQSHSSSLLCHDACPSELTPFFGQDNAGKVSLFRRFKKGFSRAIGKKSKKQLAEEAAEAEAARRAAEAEVRLAVSLYNPSNAHCDND